MAIGTEDLERFRQDFELGSDSTYGLLVWDSFMGRLTRRVAFEEVYREDAPVAVTPVRARYPLNSGGVPPPPSVTVSLPAAGTVVATGDEPAEYVLFLEGVTAYRPRNRTQWGLPGVMPGGGMGRMPLGETGERVVIEARVTLWDNRTGRPLGVRQVSGEASGTTAGRIDPEHVGRDTWTRAAEALASNVVDLLPLERRRSASGK